MPADANETAEGQGTEGQEGLPLRAGKTRPAVPRKRRASLERKRKDAKDTQIEDLTDRLKRTMAEFDNFRKRTEKEKVRHV